MSIPKWVAKEIQSFEVVSCADGTIRLAPTWADGSLDFITRSDAAKHVERHLNQALSDARKGGRR